MLPRNYKWVKGMEYIAKGTYSKKGKLEKFVKTITTENEKMAKEKLYAEMGSKQGLRRIDIKIEEIKAAK